MAKSPNMRAGWTLDDMAAAIARRIAELGYGPEMVPNSGTRRTESKRAILQAVEAAAKTAGRVVESGS